MIEDFNESEISVEEKHDLSFDDCCCKYCKAKSPLNLMECGDCGNKFCNGTTQNSKISHIFCHLKSSGHNSIKISNKEHPYIYNEIKCNICIKKNIFELFYIQNEPKKTYCKEHIPKNCQNLKSIVENSIKISNALIEEPTEKNEPNFKITQLCSNKIIEKTEALLQGIDPIARRFLNKVQLKYNNKDDYYKIYKPLVIADMKYTKSIYENKSEYEIELKVDKKYSNRKYYFEISDDFYEIDFMTGRTIKFNEVKKESLLDKNEEEDENLEFIGVITNIEQVKQKKLLASCGLENFYFYKIYIIPLNRHISVLENREGNYKIHEEFCTIPYERMLSALDTFVNDDPEDEIYDRFVSFYLTKRILGQFPTKIDLDNEKDKDGPLHKNFEDYSRIEKNALQVLFKDAYELKLVTEIKNVGKLNDSQEKAINSVFSKVLNLIQGPPGTGKTFLASFIVYNLFKLKNHDEDKILLASPSNSAADNLTLALLKINRCLKDKKMKILRVYSKTREFLEIDKDIKKVSLHEKLNQLLSNEENTEEQIDDQSYKEKIIELSQNIIDDADIVITTCSSSTDDRLNKYSFKYVLIDENTQCCEIESLIPITHACCHLTLIGDQKQLGPVVLHPKAKETGMNLSLFERLLKLYPENHSILLKQYRMHPKIIEFPSKVFYDNKIENGASIESRTNNYLNENFKWFNENIPLLFIHVEGEEKISSNGRSKYNENEAEIVNCYIKKLSKECNLLSYNIGIITPYAAQKNLIQRKIENSSPDIECLNISSVDAFQGKEKDFIILSNVRSNSNNQIGFLKDFRRLNVSITRAKYGMIIIGNAKCLSQSSEVWKCIVNYYQKNNILVTLNRKENDEYDLNNLKGMKLFEENINEEFCLTEEYDYDCSNNRDGINKDLLDNFELSQNIYTQNNKVYYKNKKRKKKKNKRKK